MGEGGKMIQISSYNTNMFSGCNAQSGDYR